MAMHVYTRGADGDNHSAIPSVAKISPEEFTVLRSAPRWTVGKKKKTDDEAEAENEGRRRGLQEKWEEACPMEEI